MFLVFFLDSTFYLYPDVFFANYVIGSGEVYEIDNSFGTFAYL